MGLFDFFKRKRRENESSSRRGPSPDYILPHRALPQVALSDPLTFLALMASPDAMPFLENLARDIEARCGARLSYPASEILCHRTRIHDFPCAILEFPEPREPVGAFLIAFVVEIMAGDALPGDRSSVPARYFTLEKGVSLDGDPRFVLGEWTTDAHHNYGDGPQPSVDAFVETLERHIRRVG